MIQVTISIWYIIMLVFAVVYLSVKLYKLNKYHKQLQLWFGQKCFAHDRLQKRHKVLRHMYKDLKRKDIKTKSNQQKDTEFDYHMEQLWCCAHKYQSSEHLDKLRKDLDIFRKQRNELIEKI